MSRTSDFGFTLIELMIAIAVLATILGLAAPSFTALVADSRASSTTNELVSALQVARSEALKRRKDVVVCRRNADGDACDNDDDWTAGWLIHVGGTPLRVWDRTADSLALAGPDGTVTFRGSGLAAAAAAFTITPSTCAGTGVRNVEVRTNGNVSLTRTDCP